MTNRRHARLTNKTSNELINIFNDVEQIFEEYTIKQNIYFDNINQEIDLKNLVFDITNYSIIFRFGQISIFDLNDIYLDLYNLKNIYKQFNKKLYYLKQKEKLQQDKQKLNLLSKTNLLSDDVILYKIAPFMNKFFKKDD